MFYLNLASHLKSTWRSEIISPSFVFHKQSTYDGQPLQYYFENKVLFLTVINAYIYFFFPEENIFLTNISSFHTFFSLNPFNTIAFFLQFRNFMTMYVLASLVPSSLLIFALRCALSHSISLVKSLCQYELV